MLVAVEAGRGAEGNSHRVTRIRSFSISTTGTAWAIGGMVTAKRGAGRYTIFPLSGDAVLEHTLGFVLAPASTALVVIDMQYATACRTTGMGRWLAERGRGGRVATATTASRSFSSRTSNGCSRSSASTT